MKPGVLRRFTFQGLPINVEIDPGQTRGGFDAVGHPWEHTYEFVYGEIDGTIGADGDAVDVYVGANHNASLVFVVHQIHINGRYDEDKVFLGFDSMRAAKEAYFNHGPEWGFGSIEAWDLSVFKSAYIGARRAAPMISMDRQGLGRERYGR